MVKLLAIAAALVGAAGATSAPAAAPASQAALPVSAAEQAQLDEAAARGALLYAYDQAAWHGTDEMQAKLADPASKIGGWIVDGPAEAPELVFFDKDKAEPHAVFLVSFRGGRLVSSHEAGPQERQLSPERRRLVAALATASAALIEKKVSACSQSRFNSVVLPPSTPGGPTLVYFLTPQPANDVIPFGRHYRVAVGADGKAGEVRAFTNSCAFVPKGPPNAVGLVVTHLLDPVPTEIHVFSSYVSKVPVYVATVKNRRMWEVDRTKIRLVKQG